MDRVIRTLVILITCRQELVNRCRRQLDTRHRTENTRTILLLQVQVQIKLCMTRQRGFRRRSFPTRNLYVTYELLRASPRVERCVKGKVLLVGRRTCYSWNAPPLHTARKTQTRRKTQSPLVVGCFKSFITDMCKYVISKWLHAIILHAEKARYDNGFVTRKQSL